MFAKYDSKFGSLRLQRPSQPSATPGKQPCSWNKIFCGTPGPGIVHSFRPIVSCVVSELSTYLDSDSLNQYDESFSVLHLLVARS
jgi:hypothetical protein